MGGAGLAVDSGGAGQRVCGLGARGTAGASAALCGAASRVAASAGAGVPVTVGGAGSWLPVKTASRSGGAPTAATTGVPAAGGVGTLVAWSFAFRRRSPGEPCAGAEASTVSHNAGASTGGDRRRRDVAFAPWARVLPSIIRSGSGGAAGRCMRRAAGRGAIAPPSDEAVSLPAPSADDAPPGHCGGSPEVTERSLATSEGPSSSSPSVHWSRRRPVTSSANSSSAAATSSPSASMLRRR
jgi:hypothetical protein